MLYVDYINKRVGGSCKASEFKEQIERLKGFRGVENDV